MARMWINLWVIVVLCGVCGAAQAKTIVLTAADWDQAALLSENTPLAGSPGVNDYVLNPRQTLLIRYSLAQIPPGMRITNAEWIMPVRDGRDVRYYVWRTLQDWGAGVCHQYRMVRPEKLAWAEPGARALGTDKFVEPTAVCRPQATDMDGGLVVNVTKDVALWYTGAALNFGWMITAEDNVYFHSPFGRGPDTWKLRITYEPE